jgi:hypothetical protein
MWCMRRAIVAVAQTLGLLGALKRPYRNQGIIGRDRSWYDRRKLRSFDWPREEHPDFLLARFTCFIERNGVSHLVVCQQKALRN